MWIVGAFKTSFIVEGLGQVPVILLGLAGLRSSISVLGAALWTRDLVRVELTQAVTDTDIWHDLAITHIVMDLEQFVPSLHRIV